MTDLNRADVIPGIGMATLANPTSDRVPANQATATVSSHAEESAVLPLLEESLAVSKQVVVTGKVRVSTRTETHDDIAEVTLDRSVVDVTRVPIGRVVDASPGVRTEGDTTIVPVIEERFVVVKQLYLKEELHIRHHVTRELSRTPVQLRRQVAVVERLDANGQTILDDPAPKS